MEKVMDETELKEFLENGAIGSLFISGADVGTKIRTICSAAMAFGFDAEWAGETLKPALEQRYLT